MFELAVLLLFGHMRRSIGVHHLWARPCFSGSSNLDSFSWWKVSGCVLGALWGVASITCSILLAAFLCNCRLSFSPAICHKIPQKKIKINLSTNWIINFCLPIKYRVSIGIYYFELIFCWCCCWRLYTGCGSKICYILVWLYTTLLWNKIDFNSKKKNKIR